MTTTDIEDLHRARIIGAMRARQGRTTDRVFASKLGVPTQTLHAARGGGHSIGIPLLAALVRAYPELEQIACAYLWALVVERQETRKRAKASQWFSQE